MSELEQTVNFGVEERTLLIDGDIIVYQPCCIFNDDSDADRQQIARNIKNKVARLMTAAGCDSYRFFVTTKLNYRNHVTDDYKANRKDIERPVNLKFAKEYAVKHFNAEYEPYLEADDLLAINQDEDTVIWSLDKDLRQVPGFHLDDATQEVIEIDELGEVRLKSKPGKPKKFYFTGWKGLMFQGLTGDSTDNIIGCGIKQTHIRKSGANKGQEYLKRTGVGAVAAAKLIEPCQTKEEALNVLIEQYKKVFGDDWEVNIEKQMNLLFMVNRFEDGKAIRWTVDGRESWMTVKTGEVHEAD